MSEQAHLRYNPEIGGGDSGDVLGYLPYGERRSMAGSNLVETPAPTGDYRALFEQSVIPMALLAAHERPKFVAASRGFLDAFGLGRVAVVGRVLSDLLSPSDSLELATAIRRCSLTSETLQSSVEVQGDAGRRRVALAVRDASAQGFAGHVVLEAGAGASIAHSAQQRLASLFQQSSAQGQSLTYIHDLKTNRVRYADAGLARRLGLSGGVTHFQDLRLQVHPDDLVGEAEFESTRKKLDDQEFLDSTIRVRDQAGEWRLINFRSRVLRRDFDGAVRMMLGIATDLTDYTAAALRMAGASLQRAEENERARIGRELHDSTCQYLVAADLGLARVLRNDDLSDEERTRLEGVQASLATAQTEMRAFSYFLHPPELRELGLAKTLEKFSAGFARRSGLQIDFVARHVPRSLPSEAEHAIFRVGQEALMNVYRHSFARRVSVSLEVMNGDLTLQVRDDGIGVDGDDRLENGGVGIAGMRTRMRNVAGELELDRTGPGLVVTGRVPVL
jgi:signal transduction histidine kinase